MILINKTYTIITEESAQDGEFAESGFVFENGEYTFKELVDMLKDDFTECSDSRPDGSLFTWFSNQGDSDMYTGDFEQESIHYSRDNLPRTEKYWRKAMVAAGVKGVR